MTGAAASVTMNMAMTVTAAASLFTVFVSAAAVLAVMFMAAAAFLALMAAASAAFPMLVAASAALFLVMSMTMAMMPAAFCLRCLQIVGKAPGKKLRRSFVG